MKLISALMEGLGWAVCIVTLLQSCGLVGDLPISHTIHSPQAASTPVR